MTRKLTLEFLIILVTLVPASAFGAWSGQTADHVISYDDDFNARQARIAVDHRDIMHVVFREEVLGIEELLYTGSTDLGTVWSGVSGDKVISFPDGNAVYQQPDIDVDTSGNIYIVWAETEGAVREILLSYSTDSGGTWSGTLADTIVSCASCSTDSASNPSIAASPDNTLHVVWQQWNAASSSLEIHYSRSSDGGATWTGTTADTIISFPDGNSASYPDIASDRLNNLYVTWQETDEVSGYQTIHFGKSNDGGMTWNSQRADIIISNPDADKDILDYFARIAVDRNGYLHVVWNESVSSITPYTYEVQYSRSTDGGGIWSGVLADTEVSFRDGQSAFYPCIATDSCSNVIVVWHEDDGGFFEQHVSLSLDNGLTWSGTSADNIISFPDRFSGFRPDIGLSSDNLLHVVWNETDDDTVLNYEIHYSKGDPLCMVTPTPTATGTPAYSLSASVTPTPSPSPGASVTAAFSASVTASMTPSPAGTRSPSPYLSPTSVLTPVPFLRSPCLAFFTIVLFSGYLFFNHRFRKIR